MALALYRKYRPATFAEVVGQAHVTEPLSNALDNGRINHAYLFSGPRGCGKTSSARILARSLNCVQGPTSTPCGACESCVSLAPDGPGNIDVIEIDAASHGGVDDARDLRERAFFAPVGSRYKVYIIDEAHMVSTQGFNALLKVVEEPPDFLVFVFATTEPEKVLTTIRSRTHHYPFRLLPPGVMRGLLEKLCAAEGARVEPNVLPLVVRAGGGSARDCLSVLDQLLASADEQGVAYHKALALLGVTDAALLGELVDAIAAGDGAAVFQTVDRVVEAGHDPRRFAADLLDRLRDLVILDAVPDAVGKGLLDVPADQLDLMTEQSARLGTATLSRLADIVHGGLADMRGTTAPRLLLELVCARMLLPAAAGDSSALLQRLERVERRQSIAVESPAAASVMAQTGRSGDAATDVSATGRPSESAEAAQSSGAARGWPGGGASGKEPERRAGASKPEAAAAADTEPDTDASGVAATAGSGLDAAGVRRVWPEILDAVKAASRRTHALLLNATATDLTGDLLTITASTVPLAKMIGEQSNVETTRAALRSVLGVDWGIAVVPAGVADATSGAAAAGSQRAPEVDRRPAPPPESPPGTDATADDGVTNDAAEGRPSEDAVPDPAPPDRAVPELTHSGGPHPPSVPANAAGASTTAVSGGAAPDDPRGERVVDAETAALQLLQSTLGARAIDRPEGRG